MTRDPPRRADGGAPPDPDRNDAGESQPTEDPEEEVSALDSGDAGASGPDAGEPADAGDHDGPSREGSEELEGEEPEAGGTTVWHAREADVERTTAERLRGDPDADDSEAGAVVVGDEKLSMSEAIQQLSDQISDLREHEAAGGVDAETSEAIPDSPAEEPDDGIETFDEEPPDEESETGADLVEEAEPVEPEPVEPTVEEPAAEESAEPEVDEADEPDEADEGPAAITEVSVDFEDYEEDAPEADREAEEEPTGDEGEPAGDDEESAEDSEFVWGGSADEGPFESVPTDDEAPLFSALERLVTQVGEIRTRVSEDLETHRRAEARQHELAELKTEELQEELDELNRELRRLRPSIDLAANRAAGTTEFDVDRSIYRVLSQVIELLGTITAEIRRHDEVAEALEDELDDLSGTVDSVEDAVSREEFAAFRSDVRSLRRDVRAMDEETVEVGGEEVALSEAVAGLVEQVDDLRESSVKEREVREWTEDAMRAGMEDLREDVESIAQAQERTEQLVHQELESLNEGIRALDQRMAQPPEDADGAEEPVEEEEDLREEVQALRAELEALRSGEPEDDEGRERDELADLREDIADMRGEMELIKDRITAAPEAAEEEPQAPVQVPAQTQAQAPAPEPNDNGADDLREDVRELERENKAIMELIEGLRTRGKLD